MAAPPGASPRKGWAAPLAVAAVVGVVLLVIWRLARQEGAGNAEEGKRALPPAGRAPPPPSPGPRGGVLPGQRAHIHRLGRQPDWWTRWKRPPSFAPPGKNRGWS